MAGSLTFLASSEQMTRKVGRIDLTGRHFKEKRFLLSKALLPFFIALITTVCVVPANSHVETL